MTIAWLLKLKSGNRVVGDVRFVWRCVGIDGRFQGAIDIHVRDIDTVELVVLPHVVVPPADVSPRGPAVFALTTLTMLAIALIASWLPARPAARISPTDALRAD
jgi:hypothetical protein